MHYGKLKIPFYFAIILNLFCIYVYLWYLGYINGFGLPCNKYVNTDVSQQFDENNFNKIEKGMTKNDVINLIGNPLSIITLEKFSCKDVTHLRSKNECYCLVRYQNRYKRSIYCTSYDDSKKFIEYNKNIEKWEYSEPVYKRSGCAIYAIGVILDKNTHLVKKTYFSNIAQD